jgi:hypothetical protein
MGTLTGDKLMVFELLRFDEKCRERVAFDGASVRFGSLSLTLIRRSATQKGLLRFLDENPEIVSEREVVIAPAKFDGDPETGLCAERHREIVKRALLANSAPSRCLHCEKYISEVQAPMIEDTDLRGVVIAGLVHNRCLKAVDRIIGISQCEFFRKYDYLY